MLKSLHSLTIGADSRDAARAQWARLGFVFPAGDDRIDLADAFIVLAGARRALFGAETERLPDAAHANGARRIAAIVGIAENPADLAEELARESGQREMRATSAGLELQLANVRREVLTAAAFRFRYGEPPDNPRPPFQALVFGVTDLARTRAYFDGQGVATEPRAGRLIVGERPSGLVVVFE